MPCSKSWLWLHILLDSWTNHLSGCIIAEVVSHGSVPSPCKLWWTEWYWKCFSLNPLVFPYLYHSSDALHSSTVYLLDHCMVLHKPHIWIIFPLNAGSHGNVVGIMTGIEIGQSRVWILIGARDVWLLQNLQTGSKTHKTSYSTVTDLLFLG
jgi:hypothetical protein